MSFGKKSWMDWVIEDKEKVFAIMKKAYDSGIRTFDTADVYSNGYSEILLKEFMEKYQIKRDRIAILTKLFFPLGDSVPGQGQKSTFPDYELINSKGLSRKHIMDAAKDSIERLGTFADVIQIHRFDPATPIEETMEALHDIVKLGYTRYIGASSMKCYQFVMMQNVAEKRGWTKFISMQNHYNLLFRSEEDEMNEYCNLTGVGIIPWSPNARGILTRPYNTNRDTSRFSSDPRLAMFVDTMGGGDIEVLNRVEKLAKDKGVSMAAIATAWILSKGCSPIIGFNKIERIDDALTALKTDLSIEDVKYLEETYDYKNLSTYGSNKK